LCHAFVGDDKFFEQLKAQDLRTAERVRAAGCVHCQGRLHRADYPRKPRGGMVAAAGEAIDRRISLCCAQAGCRRRSTPASLVFLGRRVYLAVAVVCEALRFMAGFVIGPAPARRTMKRWLGWFRSTLPAARPFAAEGGRFWPALDTARLPASLVERLAGVGAASEILRALLALLAPLGGSAHLAEAAISRER
jgi:hypothetical protein